MHAKEVSLQPPFAVMQTEESGHTMQEETELDTDTVAAPAVPDLSVLVHTAANGPFTF